jgi:hypothetical protein
VEESYTIGPKVFSNEDNSSNDSTVNVFNAYDKNNERKRMANKNTMDKEREREMDINL